MQLVKRTIYIFIIFFIFLGGFNNCKKENINEIEKDTKITESQISIKQKIRLTNGEWPPYFSEKLKHGGVTSHIIKKIFAMENIKVEYGFFPWNRAYLYAANGDWDGSVGWSWTAERDKLFYFSDTIIDDETVFFYLKENTFHWETVSDLKDITIGATLEYNYGEDFNEAKEKGLLKVDYTFNDERNFYKLIEKRFDVFVCNKEVGYSLINDIFDEETGNKITHHPKPIVKNSLTLILSKKSDGTRELLKIFNQSLKKFKESGQFDLLYEQSRQGRYKP
ncbi:MAG: transporter substrate-binding domain-containing protein [Spirochaetes bacterium]|nr:transporter substrate-binding domain-containing protein [Spirochaetota bacterium]